MRHVGALTIALTVVMLVGSVEAATTSRLEGKVVDERGGPLSGVRVTISSANLIGGAQSTTTDGGGGFAFNLLPIGAYSVEAELTGYTPATAAVPVRLDRTATVTLSLAPVTFTSEIVVTQDVPIVDASRTTTGEVFSQNYLQLATIGSSGRSYVRVMNQAAGVVPANNPRVFGATSSENAYLVDGINITDSSTGTWSGFGPFDAIAEESVLTGGIGAEFGFGTGGVVNLVTKSGGNLFSGTVDARYRDDRFNESGEYYDPATDVFSRSIVSATLGGPIVRDRLWFFAGYEYDALKITPVGAPETQTRRASDFFGKLTWSINAPNRLTLWYATSPSTTDYSGIAWYTALEATNSVEWSGPMALLELNSVISDSLLLTAAVGINHIQVASNPMVNDLETPSEGDLDRYIRFSNPSSVEFGERDRDEGRAMLTYFAGDALGSHQLDIGIEYHKLREATSVYTPGGYEVHYLNNAYWDGALPDGDGDGLVDYLLYRDYPAEIARDPVRGKADGWSAFVQDQWQPAPQVTVNLGLRYESMKHTNTVGETVADFQKWLPRLGVAWDIGGRGRHVLRAGWNRYTHPGVTNMTWFVPGITRGSEEYYGLDALCWQLGICDRETAAALVGPEFVHVDANGDEHPFYLNTVLAELPAETVDTLGVGTLRVPYRDEWLVAYEATVAQETSVELAYITKDYHDQIEDTCINNSWAWGDGDRPSLDDPSTWTDEAACTGSVRANIDGLSRDYQALVLRVASRASSWFHLVGSYTYSKTRGNSASSSPYTAFGTGPFPGQDFDFFPTNFVNLDGNLDGSPHWFKLNGYVQFPLDFTLAVGAFYRSAGSLSVWADCRNMFFPNDTGLAELDRLGIDYDEMLGYCQSPSSGWLALEPQGSRSGADLWQLDLQLSKGFDIGKVRVVGIVSVINVTSEEQPTSFTQDPFNRLGWGAPTAWQQPRLWEVGLRLEF